jgi:hypothetical protein
MRKVHSSHIDEIGYDADKQALTVVYRTGATAIYRGVPPEIGGNVMAAPFVGSAIHELVRGKYQHEYDRGD